MEVELREGMIFVDKDGSQYRIDEMYGNHFKYSFKSFNSKEWDVHEELHDDLVFSHLVKSGLIMLATPAAQVLYAR